MASEQIDQTHTRLVETKFGKCQVGCFLSYQVSLTEAHFEATASIDCVPRLSQVTKHQALTYPRFPLRDIAYKFQTPAVLNSPFSRGPLGSGISSQLW